MLFRVIVSFSLCLNTAQVVSYSFIWVRLADLRKMLRDFMHPIFCWHFIICIRSIFCIEIWNQKMCSLIKKGMLKSLISVFQRKMFKDTTRQKAFVVLLNIWHQKFCKEWVMERQVIGGVSAPSSMKCFADNHHFTTETKKSCSETSNILSPYYTTHLLVIMLETFAQNS